MILVVAATQIEMNPFVSCTSGLEDSVATLVSGVGLLETASRLYRFLATENTVRLVMNFGIGGAYLLPDGQEQPGLLDLCLATHEVLGDLGIDMVTGLEYLSRSLTGETTFPMDGRSLEQVERILVSHGLRYHTGTFISVNAASGTAERGTFLQRQWNGLCENMEGAAVARVCRDYKLPVVELRAVSNHVENRQPDRWCISEACESAAAAAALVIKGMIDD